MPAEKRHLRLLCISDRPSGSRGWKDSFSNWAYLLSSPLSGWMEAWSGGRRRAGVCWLVFGKRMEGVRGMIYWAGHRFCRISHSEKLCLQIPFLSMRNLFQGCLRGTTHLCEGCQWDWDCCYSSVLNCRFIRNGNSCQLVDCNIFDNSRFSTQWNLNLKYLKLLLFQLN